MRRATISLAVATVLLGLGMTKAFLTSSPTGSESTTIQPAPAVTVPQIQQPATEAPVALMDVARATVQRERYRINPTTEGNEEYQAINRAQQFHTTFTPEGLQVLPRTATSPTWEWQMQLIGYGNETQIQPLMAAEMIATENRLEYRRGPVTEWYINDERGLEQGFTVTAPLETPGRTGHGSLVVDLSLGGALQPQWSKEGDTLLFTDRTGTQILRYSRLFAQDAHGQRLPARLELRENNAIGAAHPRVIRLVVDDTDATYPVTIDPTLSAETQLVSNAPQDDSEFGASVATDGTTAVVGAPFEDAGNGAFPGAAYVFVRSGTTWSLQQRLTPATPGSDSEFGRSVAISGDTVAIGAPFDDSDGIVFGGAAYVFVRSGTTWSQQQKLIPTEAEDDDEFGSAVALSGNTVAVGAAFDDSGDDIFGGAAYVFVRSGTTWSQQQKLVSTDPEDFDDFGRSIAIAGDTVVVGTPAGNAGSGIFAGTAFVFVRSGSTWSLQQRLTSNAPEEAEEFGWSVSISTDTVVVGTPSDESSGGDITGAAYVFVRSGTTWSLQQRLVDSAAEDGDDFGRAVAIAGDTAVVGAPFDETGGVLVGTASVFDRSGTTWTQQQTLTPADPEDDDEFGTAVAIAGDRAVIGAPFDDAGGLSVAGAAYVFASAGGTGGIMSFFESPQSGPVSGIAVIRGWAFDTAAGETINSVEVFIDGARIGNVPCCSERADISAAFPQFPAANTLRSGWGMTFNWGILSAGPHTVRVDIRSTSGAIVSSETRAVTVTTPGNFQFVDDFALSGATASIAGDEVILQGVRVRDQETQQQRTIEARFRWFTDSQSFGMTSSVILAQAFSPQTFLASWWRGLWARVPGIALISSAYASPDIMSVFESPENGAVSGIAVVRGWAFDTAAVVGIRSVEIFIDGQRFQDTPCCSERADIRAAFPQFPETNTLNSGWGITLNWGIISAGAHTVQVLITNTGMPTPGTFASDVRVTVVKPGGFAFVDQFTLGTVARIEGEEIVLEGVRVRDAATQQTATVTLRLRFSQSAQGLVVVSAT